MSLLPKQTFVQSFQWAIYDQDVPEHFVQPAMFRPLSTPAYRLDATIMSGGHMLRFACRNAIAIELVTEYDRIVPSQGLIASFLCPSERDFIHRFPVHAPHPANHPAPASKPRKPAPGDSMVYMTSVTTETLPESLYLSTYRELLDFGRQTGAVVHLYTSPAGKCLSMVDMQKHEGQAHVQAFHTSAATGLILRMQSIFELA